MTIFPTATLTLSVLERGSGHILSPRPNLQQNNYSTQTTAPHPAGMLDLPQSHTKIAKPLIKRSVQREKSKVQTSDHQEMPYESKHHLPLPVAEVSKWRLSAMHGS